MTENLPSSTRIVFDTNVLISAFVFSGFAADIYDYCVLHFELHTSEWILDEFSDKLEHKFRYLPERRSRIIATIRERHIVTAPTNDLPVNSSDPDDNNVIRAALFIEANFLITGDSKHLLILKQVGSTEIISPRAFFDRFIV